MREVGVLEAKTNLSALIDAVERGGEEIVITRHGKRVARLVADTTRPRKLSGEELAERFRLLRERIARENPESDNLTWEDLRRLKEGGYD
ncbi:type II toxin-antitoxin system Phd/YefM family antitoxin [Phenylobacterium sp.]|uniref:type II toxin-antitoxin system Phd/YefM family antitoxin n=1 Tax=Phenylobacterium sp. TaxID=1871053 RepID=UPI0025CE53FF|nr:type II toxin-antitoxin system Phd/YefM family antitoxin [Phenylobacterium sp.]MBX3483448.1 type II toxin-antitoxin system Phd/YefM family antitoxin [Phenylobacterium sp.]MCW5758461.1 type II toxin-antitoxin system Phd/YefM family antitoxin [Phenylobacterium sp.]